MPITYGVHSVVVSAPGLYSRGTWFKSDVGHFVCKLSVILGKSLYSKLHSLHPGVNGYLALAFGIPKCCISFYFQFGVCLFPKNLRPLALTRLYDNDCNKALIKVGFKDSYINSIVF